MKQQTPSRLHFTLSIVSLLSQHSRTLTVTQIQAKLEEQGIKASIRAIQRALKNLDESALFNLTKDNSGKTYRWSIENYQDSQYATFQAHEALAWVMTEKYLDKLLPQVVFKKLEGQFDRARAYLDSSQSHFYYWENKIRAINPSKQLLPAAITEESWSFITLAILESKPIDVEYLNRSKNRASEHRLHPLGLVLKGNSIYLLAMINNYNDVKQFALNRFSKVRIVDDCLARSKPGFDIDDYIDRGNFEIPLDENEIQLKAIIDDEVAFHLQETPISQNQKIYQQDERLILEANTIYSRQTIWWIMGFGSKITVLEPRNLQAEIKENFRLALKQYQHTDEQPGE